MSFIWLLPIAALSGVFGRMGGAGKHGNWYDRVLDTKWRDIGCSILVVLSIVLYLGWYSSFWWVYVLIFGLHWLCFSTYFDWLFGGDCMWFSGLMVGLALFPILLMDIELWWLLVGRCVILMVAWEALNRLPQKILIWNKEVVEEFSRYFIAL